MHRSTVQLGIMPVKIHTAGVSCTRRLDGRRVRLSQARWVALSWRSTAIRAGRLRCHLSVQKTRSLIGSLIGGQTIIQESVDGWTRDHLVIAVGCLACPVVLGPFDDHRVLRVGAD